MISQRALGVASMPFAFNPGWSWNAPVSGIVVAVVARRPPAPIAILYSTAFCDSVKYTARVRLRIGRFCRSSAACAQGPVHLPLSIPLGDVAALVLRFLAARKRDLDLRAPVLPVEARRDEREASLPDLPGERLDLATLEQQPPIAVGVVVRDVAVAVLRNVRADEPHLAATELAVRALQVRLPIPERLHLGPHELETRLDLVEQVVVVPRAAIVHDRF